jgi:hypothetical protein
MVDIPPNMSIPQIEQVKIQARVLIPVVKAFQAELGEERANEVVRNALDGVARRTGQAANSFLKGNPVEKVVAGLPIPAASNALAVEVMAQTSEVFEFNVTGCRYAEFYKQLGEPELGFLFSCSGDWALAEGLSPDLELTRTQTIMQGASHCDFRYRLRKARSS